MGKLGLCAGFYTLFGIQASQHLDFVSPCLSLTPAATRKLMSIEEF
ncbi:hypothetical protein Patl1_24005 [Pistacia atlantica]|uniref:Uncharacterized protein n=1 Tax=Pistacia atlantica TaxID=434234 RepID=A0ACC0ZVV2_9ROSI|nr:hypothetical protein Patl1_24005 [Pistacia atlantica]